jgi:hypothetical protein
MSMAGLLWGAIVSLAAGATAETGHPEATEIFRCAFDQSSDKNYDGWPDGWTRRRGPGFPQYVKARIVAEPSPAGPRCLRIDLDGAGAVAYSPPIRADALHGYVLDVLVCAQQLHGSRAWLSLTFLDHRQRRLESCSSPPLGDTGGWVRWRLGPVSPACDDASQVRIGLHLEPGANVSLAGTARFADVWLGRLPRVSLALAGQRHLLPYPSPVNVVCRASGYTVAEASVSFSVEDALGRRLCESHLPLKVGESSGAGSSATTADPADRHGEAQWSPVLPGPGFYRVRAVAKVQKETLHRRELTLAMFRPYERLPGNEFGWSLPQADRPLALAPLAELIEQAGIGRVKFPLWLDAKTGEDRVEKLVAFNERLRGRGIEVIGMLDRLPDELRRQFDDASSLSAAEVFAANGKLGLPVAESALVRLSGQIRWWQLAGDRDQSFVGYPGLAAKLAEIKGQLGRSVHDLNLGIGWNWLCELPPAPPDKTPWAFFSLSADPPLSERELAWYLSVGSGQATGGRGQSGTAPTSPLISPVPRTPRWVVLEPLPRSRAGAEARAAQLAIQMLTCKVYGAEGAFLADPFDPQCGLMEDAGAPGELFLPWRTAALWLAGSSYLGALELPSASRNLVFLRGNQPIMAVWNGRPVEEEIGLGDDVRVVDLWGGSRGLGPPPQGQRLPVGPLPQFVIGLSEALVRWHLSVALDRDRIASVPGVKHPLVLGFRNCLATTASGTAEISAPAGWRVEPRRFKFYLPAGAACQTPLEVVLPDRARCGPNQVSVAFRIQTDRGYQFTVPRRVEVGLGDVVIEAETRLGRQGELEVEQRLSNHGPRPVQFRCELFAPHHPRQRVQALGPEGGRCVNTYRLSDGRGLLGKELWLRAEEVGGPRVLNYRFTAEP